VQPGSRILLDDGSVEVEVLSKGTAHGEVQCKVLNQGMLGNKKGMLPLPMQQCLRFPVLFLLQPSTT
jgi:pyruvate kinase